MIIPKIDNNLINYNLYYKNIYTQQNYFIKRENIIKYLSRYYPVYSCFKNNNLFMFTLKNII